MFLPTDFHLCKRSWGDKLKEADGSLWNKPKWMHKKTFKMINDRHSKYEWKSEIALHEESFKYYGVYP